MAFLRNRSINLINIHYGIQALAMGMGGIFFMVFLLRGGLPVASVLVIMALILLGRFAMRPVVLVVAKRWGLKPALIIGTLILSLQYPMLAEVHGIGWPLAALIFIASLGDTFYWSCYHAYFASLGDSEHRGHQVGAREALAAVVGIVAPLIGAWALLFVGPHIAFTMVGVVQACGALPLLGTPNVAVLRTAPGAFRSSIPGILLFFCDGWFQSVFAFLWPLALFLTLSKSYQAYGGAMALASFVGAVGGMLLGRHIDAGHGRRAVLIAYGVAASILLFRAFSIGTPWLSVAANALGSLSACLQVPTMMAVVYNFAKASPCALRFHIAAEGGWDAGAAGGCLIVAAFAAHGIPLSLLMTIGFPGLAASAILLRHYYAANAIAIDPPPVPEIPPSMTLT